MKRSAFHHLLTTIVPINDARIAKLDAWGAAIILALLVGTVDLMRILLAK